MDLDDEALDDYVPRVVLQDFVAQFVEAYWSALEAIELLDSVDAYT